MNDELIPKGCLYDLTPDLLGVYSDDGPTDSPACVRFLANLGVGTMDG